MKNFLLLFATVVSFVACNNDSKTGIETSKEIVADTTTQYTNSVNTDTAKTRQLILAEPSHTEINKQKGKKSGGENKIVSTEATVTNNKPGATNKDNTTVTPQVTTGTTDTKTNTSTAETKVTPEKKGMSNSAKDAIIGGGVGAVGGAIISKKKGKGAVIGGLLGAGAGYLLGKNKDKKDTLK